MRATQRSIHEESNKKCIGHVRKAASNYEEKSLARLKRYENFIRTSGGGGTFR